MKKKACRKDRLFVDGNECPICGGSQFVTNWKGRIHILDADNSQIAQKIGVSVKGEYALKVN